MKEKRRRNFSEIDKHTLLEILKKYVHIIENKSTRAVFVHKKNAVWHRVTREFNCVAQTGPRTAKQLKVLYDNLKRESKRCGVAEYNRRYLGKLQEVLAAKDQKEIDPTVADQSEAKMFEEQGPLITHIKEEQEEVKPSLEIEADNAPLYFDCPSDDKTTTEPFVPQRLDQQLEEKEIADVATTPYSLQSDLTIRRQSTFDLNPLESQLTEDETDDGSADSLSQQSRPRKRKLTANELKRQYYLKKIKCAQFDLKSKRIIHDLQVKLLKLEIKAFEYCVHCFFLSSLVNMFFVFL